MREDLFTSTPPSSSNRTFRASLAAKCNAVTPASLTAFGSAPFAISSFMASRLPNAAANISGV